MGVGVLVVTLWILFAVLHLPLWLPLVLTLVPTLVFGAVFMFRYMNAIRNAGALEHALSQQADGVRDRARPDLSAELKELSDEFNKAVASLKSSHLKGGGRGALYALPWYALVGPPGSGKTTALRNSGLHFPYMSSQRGGALKGVGGTRNCDWWLTNEGILLDTAGRWSTQDDEEEWVSFLKLLKQHRRRQPLNGLIVAVSLGEIVEADDETRARLAKRLRQRLDDLVVRLETTTPVYVLFTKCDLIPGFVETFGEMTKSERGQIWGFTSPLTRPIESVGGYFKERFTELLAALEQHALWSMGQTRRKDDRTMVFSFTRQFAATREDIEEFLNDLFQPNVYSGSPLFRGVYFTSGTQEGRLVDRLLKNIASEFGIEAEIPVSDVQVPKSYFLTHLFSDVIFKDQKVAAPTEKNARRRRYIRFSAAMALFVAAALFAVLPISAWAASQRFIYSTEQVIKQVTQKGGSQLSSAAWVQRLEGVRLAIAKLDHYQKHGPPKTIGFGMYRGDALYEPLRKTYVGIVRERVARPVVESAELDLRRLAERYAGQPDVMPPLKEYFDVYSALKTYLYLTEPKEANEPSFDGDRAARERPWLARQVAERWGRVRGGQVSETTLRSLQAQVDEYLGALAENTALASPRSQEAVSGTRRALGRVSSAKIALEKLIIDYEKRGFALDLRKIVGSGGSWLVSSERVRGAFTRDAWDDSVRDRLYTGEVGLGEGWVVAGPLRGDAFIARARAHLRDVYFQAYVEEWQRFIQSLEIRPVGDAEGALGLLQELTRGNPPVLGRLFERIHRETHLPEPQQGNSDAVSGALAKAGAVAAKTAPPAFKAAVQQAQNAVDERSATDTAQIADASALAAAYDGFTQFGVPPSAPAKAGDAPAPPPVTDLSAYQEQLAFLRDALQLYRENPSNIGALTERLQQARVRVLALLDTQSPDWRPRLESLLWPPIETASVNQARSVATGTGSEWCAQVYSAYERTISGRYPFSHRGEDVSVQDFSTFYNPTGGTLWAFFDSVLAQQIKSDGKSYKFAVKGGDGMYQQSLLTFLNDSRAISRAFFPPGSAGAKVEFDILVHPTPGVASITIKAHGQQIRYRNGPESWTRIQWPGTNPAEGASLEAAGAAGRSARFKETGEWGLFRLLERGHVVPSTKGSSLLVAWPLEQDGAEIAIEIKASRADSPLGLQGGRGGGAGGILDRLRSRQLRAPKSITSGGGRCGG